MCAWKTKLTKESQQIRKPFNLRYVAGELLQGTATSQDYLPGNRGEVLNRRFLKMVRREEDTVKEKIYTLPGTLSTHLHPGLGK